MRDVEVRNGDSDTDDDYKNVGDESSDETMPGVLLSEDNEDI